MKACARGNRKWIKRIKRGQDVRCKMRAPCHAPPASTIPEPDTT